MPFHILRVKTKIILKRYVGLQTRVTSEYINS